MSATWWPFLALPRLAREIYMQADPSHTNATVYELIAKAILEALNHNGRLREHVGR